VTRRVVGCVRLRLHDDASDAVDEERPTEEIARDDVDSAAG
jgi:hypothetical protein